MTRDENVLRISQAASADTGALVAVEILLSVQREVGDTVFDHERFAGNMRRCQHWWWRSYVDSAKIRDLFSFANIERNADAAIRYERLYARESG